jgi:hypothetical protein
MPNWDEMNLVCDKMNARPHPDPLPRGEGETFAGSRKSPTVSSFVGLSSEQPSAAHAEKLSEPPGPPNRYSLFPGERVRVRARLITNILFISLCSQLSAFTTESRPFATAQSIALADARWTSGFWFDRFELCRTNMLPNMERLMEGTNYSHFLRNFEIAAGTRGRTLSRRTVQRR